MASPSNEINGQTPKTQKRPKSPKTQKPSAPHRCIKESMISLVLSSQKTADLGIQPPRRRVRQEGKKLRLSFLPTPGLTFAFPTSRVQASSWPHSPVSLGHPLAGKPNPLHPLFYLGVLGVLAVKNLKMRGQTGQIGQIGQTGRAANGNGGKQRSWIPAFAGMTIVDGREKNGQTGQTGQTGQNGQGADGKKVGF